MKLEDGDYILGVWNSVGKFVEIMSTARRPFGSPENEWEVESRMRFITDDKVFDSEDEKYYFSGSLTGNEEEAID